MWKNETNKEQEEILSQNKPYNMVLPQKNTEDNDKIMLMQGAICVAIIIFILFFKFLSTPFFIEIKEQYQYIISSGIDLTQQGEIVRFISAFSQNIKEKVLEAFNSIDAPQGKGGSEKGSEINFLIADLAYKISVTPYPPVDNIKVNSGYARRKNPITHKQETHGGIDLNAKKGENVFASYAGQVETSGTDKIRGNYIILKHTNNLRTLYQHLNNAYVIKNDEVIRGQIIGTVGSTGLSTGPHLHYEFIVDNICVNPAIALRYKK